MCVHVRSGWHSENMNNYATPWRPTSYSLSSFTQRQSLFNYYPPSFRHGIRYSSVWATDLIWTHKRCDNNNSVANYCLADKKNDSIVVFTYYYYSTSKSQCVLVKMYNVRGRRNLFYSNFCSKQNEKSG